MDRKNKTLNTEKQMVITEKSLMTSWVAGGDKAQNSILLEYVKSAY